MNPFADTPSLQKVPPYSMLAAIYDRVMAHVNYQTWADYLHALIQHFHPSARSLHELACGTGNLTLALWKEEAYPQVSGSDRSPEMITVARRKAEQWHIPVHFSIMDFQEPRLPEPVDTVILVYDALNYLLTEAAILRAFERIYTLIRPGGLFIFDLSTPANSLNNAGYFEDMGVIQGIRYIRRSTYDPAGHLHRTWFLIEKDGERYLEEHVERAYEMQEIATLLKQTPFAVEAVYDEMTTRPGTSDSERLHWILRKPAL